MKTKFTLAWILSIIASLAIAIFAFLSQYFKTQGNIGLSFILPIIIMVSLLLIVFILVKLKKQSNRNKFKICTIVEISILLSLIIISIIFYIPSTSHYFNVLDRQDTIKNMVDKQVGQLDLMIKNYQQFSQDRVVAYERDLRMIERNRYDNTAAWVEARLDRYSIRHLVIDFSSDIELSDSVKTDVANWAKKITNKTSKVGLVALLPEIKEIGIQLEDVKEQCKKLDSERDEGRNNGTWNYDLDVNETIINKFSEPGKIINIVASIIDIILLVISLLPYFVAERDPYYRGIPGTLINDDKDGIYINI